MSEYQKKKLSLSPIGNKLTIIRIKQKIHINITQNDILHMIRPRGIYKFYFST